MKYIITGKNFVSPLLERYKNQNGFIVMSEAELEKSNIELTESDKVYAPDETSVPILLSRMKGEKKDQIESIKNKYNCRLLLKNTYPNFYFKAIKLKDLEFVELPKDKRYIIKPQKGFFGAGIREINGNSDLKTIAEEIMLEIQERAKFFSKDVFTADDFIVEEYIDGDEYTFDLFYNEEGKPIITNMCCHPMSKFREYFHLLYYTDRSIYERFYDQIIDIFTKFNKTLKIKNLPIHAEFKKHDNQLIPIEFNLPRFGGFGLADLPYYGFNLEPFKHFFEGTKPNWEEIFKKYGNKCYGWVLCHNGIGVDLTNNKPDYEKIKNDLGRVLHFYTLDYAANPVFAIAYIERDDRRQLNDILELDFRDYFVPINK